MARTIIEALHIIGAFMNAQQQSNRNGSVTLTALNKELTQLCMPILSRERASAVLNIAPREKFIDAVFAAHKDVAAKQFISQVFRQTGIFEAEKMGAQVNAALEEQPTTTTQQHPAQSGNQQPPVPPQGTGGDSAPRETESRQYNENFHVYGAKAALCFEADMTRANLPTIAIDGAPSVAPRSYNWNSKIRIQLTRQELPEVAAVLIGARPKCSFKSHGSQKDKGFEIERQDGGKVFVKVFGGNGQGACAVPVMPNDVFYVTSLVLRQLMAATGLPSLMDVTALLWATHGNR